MDSWHGYKQAELECKLKKKIIPGQKPKNTCNLLKPWDLELMENTSLVYVKCFNVTMRGVNRRRSL